MVESSTGNTSSSAVVLAPCFEIPVEYNEIVANGLVESTNGTGSSCFRSCFEIPVQEYEILVNGRKD